METVSRLVVIALALVSSGSCQPCADLDTSACARLVQAKPDFCSTSPLANSACKRSCNNCPLTCYHCPHTPVRDPKQCTNTTACPTGKTCMLNTLHAHDGHVEYMMSCGEKLYCDGLGFGFHPAIGRRRVQSRDLSLGCCHSDLCNEPAYTTTTPVPSFKPTTVPTIYNCHNDIIFVVDESGSIGLTAFHKALGFVTDLVNRLNIGIHETQVGLLVFDSHPHLEWNLNEYTTKAGLLSALTYVPYHDGISRTDLALRYVRENMFEYNVGDRITAKNVVVILTDGRSNIHSATVAEAQRMHSAGIRVIAVGVGTTMDQELRDLATDSNHAIKVIGYDHFPNAIPLVLPLIC